MQHSTNGGPLRFFVRFSRIVSIFGNFQISQHVNLPTSFPVCTIVAPSFSTIDNQRCGTVVERARIWTNRKKKRPGHRDRPLACVLSRPPWSPPLPLPAGRRSSLLLAPARSRSDAAAAPSAARWTRALAGLGAAPSGLAALVGHFSPGRLDRPVDRGLCAQRPAGATRRASRPRLAHRGARRRSPGWVRAARDRCATGPRVSGNVPGCRSVRSGAAAPDRLGSASRWRTGQRARTGRRGQDRTRRGELGGWKGSWRDGTSRHVTRWQDGPELSEIVAERDGKGATWCGVHDFVESRCVCRIALQMPSTLARAVCCWGVLGCRVSSTSGDGRRLVDVALLWASLALMRLCGERSPWRVVSTLFLSLFLPRCLSSLPLCVSFSLSRSSFLTFSSFLSVA